MITIAEFNRVQEIIDGRKKVIQNSNNFYFMKLLKCGECGSSITCEQHSKRYKNGTYQTYVYYRCTKKLGPCTQKYINQSNLELEFRRAVSDVAIPIAWISKWEKLTEKYKFLDRQNREANVIQLENESESVDLKLNTLLDAFWKEAETPTGFSEN